MSNRFKISDGNVTADPELRFTPNGSAVANFTVADNPKKKDATGNWVDDGETIFVRCQVWGEMAENVSESFHKGTAVNVEGILIIESYIDKNTQEKRTSMKLKVTEVSPSLKFATAKVEKKFSNRNNTASRSNEGSPWGAEQAASPRVPSAPVDDAPPF